MSPRHAQPSSAETCDIVGADEPMARGTYRYRHGALMAPPSLHLQIFRTLFALVWNDVIGDLVAFTEVVQAGPLNGRNMDEHILTATAIRRDETIPLSRVEPLHSTCRHVRSPFGTEWQQT